MCVWRRGRGQDGEKITLRLLDRAALKGFDELFRRHGDVGDYLANLYHLKSRAVEA